MRYRNGPKSSLLVMILLFFQKTKSSVLLYIINIFLNYYLTYHPSSSPGYPWASIEYAALLHWEIIILSAGILVVGFSGSLFWLQGQRSAPSPYFSICGQSIRNHQITSGNCLKNRPSMNWKMSNLVLNIKLLQLYLVELSFSDAIFLNHP